MFKVKSENCKVWCAESERFIKGTMGTEGIMGLFPEIPIIPVFPEIPENSPKKATPFNTTNLISSTTQFLVRRAPSATLGEKGDDG